jgi:hypothetical protein
MRHAEIRKLSQRVGMWLQAARRTFALGEKREAVIDHVVGEDAAVGIFCGLRGIEARRAAFAPCLSTGAKAKFDACAKGSVTASSVCFIRQKFSRHRNLDAVAAGMGFATYLHLEVDRAHDAVAKLFVNEFF